MFVDFYMQSNWTYSLWTGSSFKSRKYQWIGRRQSWRNCLRVDGILFATWVNAWFGFVCKRQFSSWWRSYVSKHSSNLCCALFHAGNLEGKHRLLVFRGVPLWFRFKSFSKYSQEYYEAFGGNCEYFLKTEKHQLLYNHLVYHSWLMTVTLFRCPPKDSCRILSYYLIWIYKLFSPVPYKLLKIEDFSR